MIPRPRPERFRLRRTMMFMNAQKPGLIKDAYIYGADSIMLDLEDAVAENQKDAARFSLYHALRSIDYGDTEVIVRINGLDTPHWREDVRVCVAGGADGIRIAKCESADDVHTIERAVEEAEREFGVEQGRTLLMAALESPKGVLNACEICLLLVPYASASCFVVKTLISLYSNTFNSSTYLSFHFSKYRPSNP